MDTNNIQNKKKSKRIFYFDALRALAIIAVILSHVYTSSRGMIFNEYNILSLNWIITDIMGNCFRFGVDIFLMLSGALSLGRVWDIKSFLGKRLPRIALPFIFWGFVLSLFLVIFSYFSPQLNVVDSFDLGSFLNYLYNSYMANNNGFGPYWFFWMILGTYLIMPILNKWLLLADLKEAEYFIVIWLITCLFENTLMIHFPVKLTYFTGPIGMVILGYYLRHTERKLLNNPYVALLIFAIGFVSLFILSYMMSSVEGIYSFDRYSILFAIEVCGLFLLFKNFNKLNIHIGFLENPNGIFRKSIFSIAKYSYGIYLIHSAVLLIVKLKLKQYDLAYMQFIVLLFLGVLFVSWAVMAILNRIPYLNQVIGAK